MATIQKTERKELSSALAEALAKVGLRGPAKQKVCPAEEYAALMTAWAKMREDGRCYVVSIADPDGNIVATEELQAVAHGTGSLGFRCGRIALPPVKVGSLERGLSCMGVTLVVSGSKPE